MIDIKARLQEIQDEFCPLTEEQALEAEARQDYDPCNCSICNLLRDIITDEVWAEQDNIKSSFASKGVKVA